MRLRKPLTAIAIAVALGLSAGLTAQPKGQMMEAILTVTKVDAGKRTVYARGPRGEAVIGVPEQIDLSQVRPGARYLVRYQEAVAISVQPGASFSAGEGPGRLTDADRTLVNATGTRMGSTAGIVESNDGKRITLLATDGTRQTFLLANQGLGKSIRSGDSVTVGYEQAAAAHLRSTPQPERDPAPAQ